MLTYLKHHKLLKLMYHYSDRDAFWYHIMHLLLTSQWWNILKAVFFIFTIFNSNQTTDRKLCK